MSKTQYKVTLQDTTIAAIQTMARNRGMPPGTFLDIAVKACEALDTDGGLLVKLEGAKLGVFTAHAPQNSPKSKTPAPPTPEADYPYPKFVLVNERAYGRVPRMNTGRPETDYCRLTVHTEGRIRSCLIDTPIRPQDAEALVAGDYLDLTALPKDQADGLIATSDDIVHDEHWNAWQAKRGPTTHVEIRPGVSDAGRAWARENFPDASIDEILSSLGDD